jgi:4-hydroxy-tetrahydrodipicolinate reductase
MKVDRQKVVQIGFGPIGRAVARAVVDAPDMELVGVVDTAPSVAGKEVGALLRREALEGMAVAARLRDLKGVRGAVAVQATRSRFPEVLEQIGELVDRRIPVVSTCEELIAAEVRWPRESADLERRCARKGVRVLPAGANPGFLMDLLPLVLTGMCVRVKKLRATRRVDTAKRRPALQEKTGAGLSAAQFNRRARRGEVGHVGLRDSLLWIVDQLGEEGPVSRETIRPVIAERTVKGEKRVVRKGEVAGSHQVVRAYSRDRKRVIATLDLTMAFGLREPFDEIRIDGDPPVLLRFEGGVNGDRATVGSVLSAVRRVRSLPPGFGVA